MDLCTLIIMVWVKRRIFMKQMPKGILEIKNFPKEINYLTFPERLKITPSAYFKYN